MLKDYINTMVSKGFIYASKTPLYSSILFVKKHDSSFYLCIDYRKLNDITIKNCYALPLISELFDWLKSILITLIWLMLIINSELYSVINIKIFHTCYNYFEYLVMPFSLTNAPILFKAYANDYLHEFLNIFYIIYLFNCKLISYH